MKKVCPNCAKFIDRKDDICPYCKKPVKIEHKKPKSFLGSIKHNASSDINPNDIYQKTYDETDIFVDVQTNNNDESKTKSARPRYINRHKKQKVANPRKNGVHIDVRKAFIFGKKGELGVPKKYGTYELEKLKWWEIYRFLDRANVKRKINKVVKKESYKKPASINLVSMFILTILFGYSGAHNLYAKNYGKGLFQLICFTVSIVFVVLYSSFGITWLENLWVTLCALPGFLTLLIWMSDLISLIFKKFKYKDSRLEYIKTLDIETRAYLGKKYIYMV